MTAKKFAFYGGLLMLIIGVMSFIPGLQGTTDNLPALKLDISYARFMGIFPMNMMNKLALIGFGIGGIWMSKKYLSEAYSVQYCRFTFWSMGLLAVLGLFERTNTLGGYWPLFAGEIIAHGVFALAAGYFGYVLHHLHAEHSPDAGVTKH